MRAKGMSSVRAAQTPHDAHVSRNPDSLLPDLSADTWQGERMPPVSVESHLRRVLALGSPLEAVTLPLGAARSCALADPLHAPIDLPPFDNAAMDGYAVRADDVADGTAVPVAGTGAAGGEPPPALARGYGARIMTGAPLPAAADTVVPVEHTDRGVAAMTVLRPVPRGANIRRAGEDLAAGSVAADAGEPLNVGRLALLSALGIATVRAHRRPVVSVLATGTELVSPGQPLRFGAIYESNATMLGAALAADGADVRLLPHVRDEPVEALAVLRAAATESDLLLTAGGISAGDYEVVKQALGSVGSVEFGTVAMSPGRPQGHGQLDGTPVVCLPGNPVSAFLSYLLFAGPLVRRLLGWAEPGPRWRTGVLAQALSGRADRTQLILGREVTDGVARAGSAHLLSTLARADCVLRLDPGAEPAAGSAVPLLLL